MDSRSLDRLRRALERHRGKSVKMISKSEWNAVLIPGGELAALQAVRRQF